MAIQIAKDEWGVDIQDTGNTKLPLIGPEGCIAPPHVRPLCAAHVCEGTLMRQSLEFQDEYFKIRDRISALEFQKEKANRNAI